MDCEINEMHNLKSMAGASSACELEIFEKETGIKAIKKESAILEKETEIIMKQIEQIEKNNFKMATQLQEINEAVVFQQESARIAERSAENHKILLEKTQQEVEQYGDEQIAILKLYYDELEEQKQFLEKTTRGYKEMQIKKIKVTKLRFEVFDLQAKIRTIHKIRRQFEDIQWLMTKNDIVKFAHFYVDYNKQKSDLIRLQELKKEERQLLTKYMEMQRRKQSEGVYGLKNLIHTRQKTELPQAIPNKRDQPKDLLKEKFLSFMNNVKVRENLKPKIANKEEENSKLKILDVQILPPPSVPNSPIQRKRNPPQPIQLNQKIQNLNQPELSPVLQKKKQKLQPQLTSFMDHQLEERRTNLNKTIRPQKPSIPFPNNKVCPKMNMNVKGPNMIMRQPPKILDQMDFSQPQKKSFKRPGYSQEEDTQYLKNSQPVSTTLSLPLKDLNVASQSQRLSQKRKEQEDTTDGLRNGPPEKKKIMFNPQLDSKRPILQMPTSSKFAKPENNSGNKKKFGNFFGFSNDNKEVDDNPFSMKNPWDKHTDKLFGTSNKTSAKAGRMPSQGNISTWYTATGDDSMQEHPEDEVMTGITNASVENQYGGSLEPVPDNTSENDDQSSFKFFHSKLGGSDRLFNFK